MGKGGSETMELSLRSQLHVFFAQFVDDSHDAQ